MADTQAKPHLLMIAFPLQGHLIPFLHLATKLSSNGFIITYVNTESIHHQISNSSGDDSDIFAGARQSGLDIRYTTVSDGLPLGFDRSLNVEQFVESLLHDFSAHVDELVGELVVSNSPVTCLISDTFFVGALMIAKKYNLVNISFWTEPALIFTLYYHLDLLKLNGHFGQTENRKDDIDYVPGVKPIKTTDLTSYLQSSDITTAVHRITYKAFDVVKQADIIICNTVQELESETILAVHQKQPTYAIGPIFPPDFTNKIVPTSLWSESDCTHWLNTKPHGSVLYISFGSLAHTTTQVIEEMANGLLLSEVSFIWVLRRDIVSSVDVDILPVGFEESVRDRGLIVPWCHQKAVISHPAIGGFLTHCGWNSILESIWCSVPMICYPLFTDQLTNRKLVVDDWKIGINLCDGNSITAKEVVEKINCLMNGNTSENLRKKIKEVKHILENALAKDGSSQQNYDKFIKDLNVKIHNKNTGGICCQTP